MPTAEQMHQAAPRDAVGHYRRDLFNVCGLCFPDAIESFSNATTKLDNAQNIPPTVSNSDSIIENKIARFSVDSDHPALSSIHPRGKRKIQGELYSPHACDVLYHCRMSIARISKYSASA
jgi:hypothetical protein